MIKSWKKIIVVFILGTTLFLAFNYIFFISWISINKSSFMTETIAAHARETKILKIKRAGLYRNSEGIEWHENNKELTLNNKHYEVVSVSQSDSLIELCLIEDEAEDRLFDEYFSLSKKQKNKFTDISRFLLDLEFINTSANPLILIVAIKVSEKDSRPDFYDHIHIQRNLKPPCFLMSV